MYHVFIFFREREEGRDMEFNETVPLHYSLSNHVK